MTAALKTGLCALALTIGGCARGVIIRQEPQAPPPQAEERGRSGSVHVLGIPPGHLPRPGQCRLWIPGRPPGRQSRARNCAGIIAAAPAGSWIVFRSVAQPDVIRVHVVSEQRVGLIVMLRVYAADGRFVREEEGDKHHDDFEDEDEHGRGHGHRRND